MKGVMKSELQVKERERERKKKKVDIRREKITRDNKLD